MILKRMKKSRSLSLSDYLRRIASGGMIVSVNYEPVLRFTYEIKKVGINLNQIAKTGNRNGVIGLNDVRMMHECLNELNSVAEELRSTVLYAETRLTEKKVLEHLNGDRKVEK